MPTYDKDNNLIPRFEPEPEDDKPPVKKTSLKRKLVTLALVITTICGLAIYGLYEVDKFFDSNTINWQSPVKLQMPIYLSPRQQAQAKQVEVVPTAQAAEVPNTPAPQPEVKKPTAVDYDEVLRIVYRKESSSGKNDGCRTKGKYNGYGYAQSTHSWKCFDSHAEVTGLVRAWFEKRVPSMGLSTALCYYNTGHKVADCPYYRDYLKYAKSE